MAAPWKLSIAGNGLFCVARLFSVSRRRGLYARVQFPQLISLFVFEPGHKARAYLQLAKLATNDFVTDFRMAGDRRP